MERALKIITFTGVLLEIHVVRIASHVCDLTMFRGPQNSDIIQACTTLFRPQIGCVR